MNHSSIIIGGFQLKIGRGWSSWIKAALKCQVFFDNDPSPDSKVVAGPASGLKVGASNIRYKKECKGSCDLDGERGPCMAGQAALPVSPSGKAGPLAVSKDGFLTLVSHGVSRNTGVSEE